MRALAAAALLFASTASAAGFVGLLKGGPAELFDDTDLHLFLDAARKTLDEGDENQKFAWQNPKNGHRGEFTVLKRFESKGRACKQVRVHNEADLRKSTMQHNACIVDGAWRLVGDIKQGGSKK
ncbi:MAG TPA: RT0821/Lpp0805 family surface protein [Burkholderiales bacterium]|jgi:surface antigen|nr:RT0821/Lpp0805 family surface protein [Burkholderiales bacterium]